MNEFKKQLVDAGRDIALPLSFPLQDGTQVICEKVLRILPGKRLTLQGKWQDKNVVVKIFLKPLRAKKHAARDKSGIEALHHYKFNAPEILFFGKDILFQVDLIVYEFISSAKRVKNLWESLTRRDAQTGLISKMVQTLARQHALGLMQEDLHLNNFLQKRGRIYCLDGDGISHSKKTKPLSLKKSFKNLALFIENLTNYTEEHIKTAFIEYCACRGLSADEDNYALLLSSIQAIKHCMIKKNMKKTLRDCSSFVCKKGFKYFYVYDRSYDSPAVRQLIAAPDKAFDVDAVYFKQGTGCTVIQVNIDGNFFVIKRYNIRSKWYALKNLFRRTRAKNAWLSAHFLRFSSIHTVKPIGFYEEKWGPCQGRAYFISEYQSGKLMQDFSYNNKQEQQYLTLVAESFFKQLKNMFKKRMTHGDLKASNLLVRGKDVIFLDLDKTKIHKRQQPFNVARSQDIKRFLANFSNTPAIYTFWKDKLEQEFIT